MLKELKLSKGNSVDAFKKELAMFLLVASQLQSKVKTSIRI